VAASRGSDNPELIVETVTLRGTEYTVRELTIAEYRKINEQATVKRRIEDDLGEGTTLEAIDNDLQMGLIVDLTVTPAVKLTAVGVRLYGALTRTVNKVNFDVDEELKPSAEKKAESTGEGEAAPNS